MEKTILFLIFMVVFYVVPALLKKGNSKKYEYPEVPEQILSPEPRGMVGRKVALSVAAETKDLDQSAELPAEAVAQAEVAQAATEEVPPVVTEDFSPWQGGLDRSAVLNGVIYAEILRKPRAINKRIR